MQWVWKIILSFAGVPWMCCWMAFGLYSFAIRDRQRRDEHEQWPRHPTVFKAARSVAIQWGEMFSWVFGPTEWIDADSVARELRRKARIALAGAVVFLALWLVLGYFVLAGGPG